jgi:hypothetical protein
VSACAATFPIEREYITLGPCGCTRSICTGDDRKIVERRVEVVQTLTCIRDDVHVGHIARDGRGGTYYWGDDGPSSEGQGPEAPEVLASRP